MKVYSVEIASTGALDGGFIDPKTTQDYSDFNAEAGEVADYEAKAKGWIRWRNLIEKLSEMHVIDDVMDIEIPGASSLVSPTSIKFFLTYDGEPSVRLSDDSILYGEDAVKEMISFVLTHDYDMLAMVWNPTVVKQGEKDLMPKGAEFKFIKVPKLFSGVAAKNAVTVKTFDVPNPTNVSLKLSVTPPPPQSKVIINGVETTEYRGNIGDEITWSASADHFISQNGALELEQDTEINVELVEVPGTVIINPTPADATVTIAGVEQKKYTGVYGDTVDWEVSAIGYTSKSGSETLTTNKTVDVALEKVQVTVSINATPADATVTLNGEERKTITVDYGTNVAWVVSKTGYVSQNGSITPTENTTKDVALVLEKHTFSIVATPDDATVIINGGERSTFTADYGTEIGWSVGKVGYVSKEGTYTLTADKEEVVTLAKQQITITVAATPEDATVKLNGVAQKSVTVDYGTEVSYEVSKTGYVSKSGKIIADKTQTVPVELMKQQVTLTIVPTPEDATVKLNGVAQKSVTVEYGTEVTYEVSKTGYDTKTAKVVVDETKSLPITLSKTQVTLTITPTPANATVKINDVEQNAITVDYGTKVTYAVSATGHVSKSGEETLIANKTLPVALDKQKVTVTIAPTPADATVKIDGEVKSEVTVDYGTEVSYEVSKTGYVSKSGTETVTATKTLTVILEVQKVTFAITPTPTDATVTINGTAQKSVSVDYGSEVTWEVSKTGYTTRNGTEVVIKDTTRAIELVIKQFTFTITPTPEDATVTINDVVQSSLTANYGTAITWSVAKDGFTAQNGSLSLTEDKTLPVTLVAVESGA